MSSDLEQLLEDEWYIVRYSGEIPEIAYNSALYYLTRAKDGPAVTLSSVQLQMLKNAAIDRFREIILRDIDHSYTVTSAYRGVKRSIDNWFRFMRFCERQDVDPAVLRTEVCEQLSHFLSIPRDEWQLSVGQIFNCPYQELTVFFKSIGADMGVFPEDIAAACSADAPCN